MRVDTVAVVLLASTFLLGTFFLFIYRQKRQPYVLAWSIAWLLLFAHFVARVVGVYLPDALWPNELNEAVFTVCVLVFYCSARLYRRLPIPYKSVAVAALVGVAWSVAYAHGIVSVPAVEAAVLIFFLIGYTFWKKDANKSRGWTCFSRSRSALGAC